jgi:hypothetical protein
METAKGRRSQVAYVLSLAMQLWYGTAKIPTTLCEGRPSHPLGNLIAFFKGLRREAYGQINSSIIVNRGRVGRRRRRIGHTTKQDLMRIKDECYALKLL